jgi:cytochrome c oxidase assembly protein subunit 15
MFIGGYVSSAGLGLSCPEWPLCPNGVIPNEKYFIEWTHRFIAVTTATLVIATAIVSWLKNISRKMKFTSTFAAALVVTQITLGAIVINLKLHAVLVAIHLGVGILLFSMVLLTTLFAFRIAKKPIESKI